MCHKEIFELIKVLKPSELVDIIRNMAVPIDGNKEDNLSIKLVSFLKENLVMPTEEEVIFHLYGETSASKRQTFKKLAYRTKKKIFDSLSASLAAEKYYDIEEIDIIRLQLHKKAILLHYLRFKLSHNYLIEQLQDEIINTASEYEIYGILIEHLSVKKASIALFKGEKSLNDINEQLNVAIRSHLAIDRASEWEHILRGKGSKLSFIKRDEFADSIQKKIIYLENEYKETGSSFLLYLILTLKLFFYNVKNNHEQSKKITEELLDMVQNNKVVKRKSRLGMLLNQLVILDVKLGNYGSAIKLNVESQKYFTPNTINYFVSLEIRFEILFYNKQFQEADKILEELMAEGKNHFDEFKLAKFNLFKVYVYIINKDYKAALKLNIVKDEISIDKVGYDFWVRVLTIVLNFKIGNEDAASMGVVSLKKQINRISKLKDFRKRDIIVYNILSKLSKNGFTIAASDIGPELEKLKEPGNQWEPFSAELIPFERLLTLLLEH